MFNIVSICNGDLELIQAFDGLYVPDDGETASIVALVACNAHLNHGAADQLSCHIVGTPALVSARLLTLRAQRMLRQVSLTAATTVRRHSATSAGSSGFV